MAQTVIYIDKDGNISGLSDHIFDDLTDLGEKTVERISDIEFDGEEELWVATAKDGTVIGKHKYRHQLIEIEREYLNRRIEDEYEKEIIRDSSL